MIRELLDSDELAAEKAMGHCVATCTERCAKGLATSWPLGVEEAGARRRVLTIEVCPRAKQVVQAKMKANDDPDEGARSLVEQWARQQGIKTAS